MKCGVVKQSTTYHIPLRWRRKKE